MNSRPPFRSVAFLLFASLVIALLPGCSPRTEVRSDPQGKIQFELPSGWEEVAGSSGTRFAPAGGNPGTLHIQVNTVPHNPRQSLERQRDTWLAFHREKGFEVLHSEEWEANGFKGLDYAHTMETMFGPGVWHHTLLIQGDVEVAAYLQAETARYEGALPTYRKVVESIRIIPRSD